MTNTLIPLTEIHIGESAQLVKVQGGKRLTHRLTELGLTPGVSLTVVQDAGGPLLLAVRGARVAIGRGEASKLLVLSTK